MDQAPIHFKLPLLMRLFAGAGDRLRHRIVPFEAERFMGAARRITGLHDFGEEEDFIDRVHSAVESYKQVDFNLIGRFAVRTAMHWHLINRLHVVDLLKKQPELRDIEVKAPVVIVGLFRTGTTFLHNVMATDPRSRAGRMWEVSYPVGRARDPLGDVKWRKRRTSIPLTMNHTIVPDQDVVHYVSSGGYEEDFFLMGTDMATMTQFVGLGDFQYAWNLLDTDLSGAYRWHRLQLQMLTAQRGADRWLLKCPWHLWNLESLLEVYPDAKIIHTHRDVVKAIGSQCSLTARIVCRMHRNLDVSQLAKFWVDYSVAGLQRGQVVKDRLPESQFYDVRLRDLRAQPTNVLREIYEQFDLPFDDALVPQIEHVAANGASYQRGVHEYCVEDFGLTPGAVVERFADYSERFGV